MLGFGWGLHHTVHYRDILPASTSLGFLLDAPGVPDTLYEQTYVCWFPARFPHWTHTLSGTDLLGS